MKFNLDDKEITYRKLESHDAREVTRLHFKSLQRGLLYHMGEKYAEIFYENAFQGDNCFGFAAVANNKIIGMALASKDINLLMRKSLLNWKFAVGLLKVIFKMHKIFPSLGRSPPTKEEFFMLFVEPEYRNLYTALNLIKRIDEKYAELNVKEYCLDVWENNKPALAIYERMGFKRVFSVGDGEFKRIFMCKKPEAL